MNRYKILSILYFFSILLYGIYNDISLIYIIPLGIILILPYYVRNTFLQLSTSTSISLLSILILSWTTEPLYVIVGVPLIILSCEAVFKGDTDIFIDRIVYSNFGAISLYMIFLILVVLFLSLFNNYLIIYPFTLSIYLVYSLIKFRRESRNITINIKDRYVVIREKRAVYPLYIENQGGSTWILSVESTSSNKFRVNVIPNRVTVQSNESMKIDMRIEGSLIGIHDSTMEIYIYDTRGLSRFKIIKSFKIVVKPKLSISIEIVKRFLEVYGGRGGLEEYSYIEGYMTKSRIGLFFGVRPYSMGDEARIIHLKKSVEHQKLISKEYESVGIKSSIILADISVGTPEDLDDVLNDTIEILISYFTAGFNNIGILMYSSRNVILSAPPTNPLIILKMIIKNLDKLELESSSYRYILDEPNIFDLNRFKEGPPKIEIDILKREFKSNILWNVNKTLSDIARYPSRIILIYSNSLLRNLYPLLKYNLEKYGHEVIVGIENPLTYSSPYLKY